MIHDSMLIIIHSSPIINPHVIHLCKRKPPLNTACMEKITLVTAELVALGDQQTIRATVTTEHGSTGTAELPGGISAGGGEAALVAPTQALQSITQTVGPALVGMDCLEQ